MESGSKLRNNIAIDMRPFKEGLRKKLPPESPFLDDLEMMTDRYVKMRCANFLEDSCPIVAGSDHQPSQLFSIDSSSACSTK
jgi:hypothetical protein